MGQKKKFNHAVDVAFEVLSDFEEPTIDEKLEAMERRLQYLKNNRDEAEEAFGTFDTMDNE